MTQLLQDRVSEIEKLLIARGLERSDMPYYSIGGTTVCQIWYDFKNIKSYVVEIMPETVIIGERVPYNDAVNVLRNDLKEAGF